MTRRPKVFPPIYLLAAVLAMVVLHFVLPVRQWLAWPWRWIGLVPAIIGLLMGAWAISIFHRRGTTHRPGETSSHLVTSGPFRFTRNPMYVGMVLILAGEALLLGSLGPWIVIPLFILAVNADVIPIEEAMLAERFGAEYEGYRQRVRRWI